MSYSEPSVHAHQVVCGSCTKEFECSHDGSTDDCDYTSFYSNESFVCEACKQMKEDIENMTDEERHKLGYCLNYCTWCEKDGHYRGDAMKLLGKALEETGKHVKRQTDAIKRLQAIARALDDVHGEPPIVGGDGSC